MGIALDVNRPKKVALCAILAIPMGRAKPTKTSCDIGGVMKVCARPYARKSAN
jgi:hypothetical protein